MCNRFRLLLLALLGIPLHAEGQQQWSLVPDLTIGSPDALDYSLTWVSDIAVGHNGTIYLLQPREQLIRVFSSGGEFIRVIGRRGEGPGEFRSPRHMGWKGDTLWVRDTGLRRTSLFGPEGEFITSLSVLVPPVGERYIASVPRALLEDGSFVAEAATPAQFIAQGIVSELPLVRLNRMGRITDTLAWHSTRHRVLAIGDPARRSGRFYMPQPLGDAPLWAVGPDGSSLVVVERPATRRPDEGYFRITRLNAAADTIFSRRYRYRPEEVTRNFVNSLEAEIAGYFAESRARASSEAVARKWVREALHVPKFLPPITDVVVGRDGTIWLRREDLRRSTVAWNVLDEGGTIVATLNAPRNLDIHQAQDGLIWGVEQDNFDIPYVIRYRTRK